VTLEIGVHRSAADALERVQQALDVADPTTLAPWLDDAFLAIVRDWALGGRGCSDEEFDALARATFAYQIATNVPYARFAASLGYDAKRLPTGWREIPAVPSSGFKDAVLATFDVRRAELEFHTSGTTAESSGKHFFARAALYDNALLAGFDRFMLADRPKLRYVNVVPNPRTRPHSSLGYMMGHVAVLRGDGHAGYFLEDDAVDADGFARALQAAIAASQPVCVAGTAFGFVALLEALEARGTKFTAPAGSRIMETGGFKGRTAVVERAELYARLEGSLGIAPDSIVAEYGMTELTSQYYDSPATRGPIDDARPRVKVAPPWLRTVVTDGDGHELPRGEIGVLRHVDLGNRSSVIAISTDDRGYASGEGIVLLGRDIDAVPRGCSLDAEALLIRSVRS
jgi:hypothetical protein